MNLTRRNFMAVSALTGGTLLSRKSLSAEAKDQNHQAVHMKEEGFALSLKSGNRFLALYNFDSDHGGLYKPFFYPVMGPFGYPITQNGEFPGSMKSHYWHRSLFVAHQNVNGISFWEERQADCGKMVHLEFEEIQSGEAGKTIERLAWRDLQGQDVLHEKRVMRITVPSLQSYFIDIGIALTAVNGDVTFSATPYNLLACRLRNSMTPLHIKKEYTEKYKNLVDFTPLDQGGVITNSEGKINQECKGARARWCDYSGPLPDGRWAGVTLLDHPSNPRHPTPWHNWNDMTITASFTFHESYILKKGDTLTLNYRIYIHPGNLKEDGVEQTWEDFSQSNPAD